MKSANNSMLHALAGAVLVLILVYSGEQWSRGITNLFIEITMWSCSIGLIVFTLSFFLGFLNEYCREKQIDYDKDSRKWLYYDGNLVEKLELNSDQAKDMIANAQHCGFWLCYTKITHKIERSLTYMGAITIIISSISYTIGGVIQGN